MKTNTTNGKQQHPKTVTKKESVLKALKSIDRNLLALAKISEAARKMAEAGKIVDADKMYVNHGRKKVWAICSELTHICGPRSSDSPQIDRMIVKQLVKNGSSSKGAEDLLNGLIVVVVNFLNIEKRVIPRERRLVNSGSAQFIKMEQKAARERRKITTRPSSRNKAC